MNKVASIALLFILNAFSGLTQEKSDIIQQRVEFISEQLESESIDLTNVVEQLNYYFDHPLNLNTATYEEMEDLQLLTDVQINALLLHRELFGKLISVYELQGVQYWDIRTIQLVLPFIKITDKLDQLHVSLKEAFKQGKFEAYLRYQRVVEPKAGYANVSDSLLNSSNSYYHGNQDKYYTRLRFSYRTNLSIGVTAEKDPGEEFFKGSQKNGFDFYSAHAFYKGGKFLKSVALGDYQVQIGQGLNLWTGYAFGKTADATNVKKSANPLRPYTSVDENRFLRGAAVQIGLGKFDLLAFGSYKQVDGAIIASDSLTQNEQYVQSINLSGLHRTNSEIDRKNTLNEMIFGGNIRYSTRSLKLGLAAVYQGYNKEFIKDTLPYNQFDFRGKNTVGISADYNWVIKNFNFFGEVSNSTHSGGFAQLHGVLISMDQWVSLSLLYRNYQRNYYTFYNTGLSEGSATKNEQGLYSGIRVNLTNAFSVSAYADIFKFPWLKYLVDAPSKGHEVLIQPSYRPNRKLEIYFRFREQVRQKNSRDTDASITPIEDVTQRNFRLNFSYQVTDAIRLKSRVEYVTVNRPSNGTEDGVIVTQDVIYRPKSFPLDFSLRYALFDTDSYDSRIYTYENNALYVFSSPSYYYRGSRAYALIRWTFLRKFDLWVRYGVNIYANKNSLGSGPEEIAGNTKTDLTVQLRIKL